MDPYSKKMNLERIELITNLFLKLSEQPLPDYYSVNKMVLSLNRMQNDRFRDDSFIYLHTKLRKKLFDQMMGQIMEKETKILALTGLQGSGKSHFLADFVLRNRLKKSNLRILYINNGQEYFANYSGYIMREIIYMVCLDLDFANFQPKDKFQKEEIKRADDIIEWLIHLLDYQSEDNLIEFLKNLKTYYQKQGIKLLVIWDQINIMGREIYKMNQTAHMIYNKITTTNEFFDFIFLSASNNNEPIKEIQNRNVSQILEVNPFEVFNQEEFSRLVRYECDLYNYKPKNFKKNSNYFEELFQLLNYSVSEFLSFKNAFREPFSEIPSYTFKNYNWKETQEIFTSKRTDDIQNSEEKFRNENIKLANHWDKYYQAIKFLLTFEEMKNLDKETKVK